MGYQRCQGTDCTKFAKQKKLVNQHQKAKGIDLLTLCTPCAKDLYPDYVGLECERADCTTAPQGGKHGKFCKRHSPLECERADCTTAQEGGAFGKFCRRHTPLECEHADCTTAPLGGAFGKFCQVHSPLECDYADCLTAPRGGEHGKFCFKHSAYIKPLILVEELAKNVEELTFAAISNIEKGKPVYAGLTGTSGEEEINQDTLRMINQDSTLEKESHLAIYVDGNNGQSAHDVARDAERVLIDSISIKGVFKEQKKRKALDDISNM
jgi:hypothetical protein